MLFRSADKLLADDARAMRGGLFGQDPASVARHLDVLGTRPALEAALAWYRANKGLAGDFAATKVPTLYIWGDADATVGPDAARGTGDFVAAAYALEVLRTAFEAGAEVAALCDTNGGMLPTWVADVVADVIEIGRAHV